jgi:hypothetical protein
MDPTDWVSPTPLTEDGNRFLVFFRIRMMDKAQKPSFYPFSMLQEVNQVILVFSVQGSGHFQGYAHLSGEKPDSTSTADQCFEMNGPYLSPPLPIEWIKRANIPFQATRHLLNPYNENKRVQTSHDGQVMSL